MRCVWGTAGRRSSPWRSRLRFRCHEVIMPGHAITIVDDDDNFLEQLRGVLGAAGYTVHTFNRPESAYDAVRANPPGAVIIGIQFPNCQPGIDLATALKLRPETRALPIIL